MPNSSGQKALLTISACAVNNGKISVDSSKKKFEALINPAVPGCPSTRFFA